MMELLISHFKTFQNLLILYARGMGGTFFHSQRNPCYWIKKGRHICCYEPCMNKNLKNVELFN